MKIIEMKEKKTYTNLGQKMSNLSNLSTLKTKQQ